MPVLLDDIYQQIGESITACIDEKWLFAEVVVEFDPDVRTFEGYYISEESGKRKGFRLSQNTKDLLEELHEQMAEEPKGNWEKAKFRLKRDGEFTLSFEYG